MAKITIAGDAVVVTSSMTLEDLKLIKKYRPKALNLMGGENNKELLFSIMIGNGAGSVNENGAIFGRTTPDDAKLACITMHIGEHTGSVTEFVADMIGGAVGMLSKIEETLPAVVDEIKAERESILANIQIVG